MRSQVQTESWPSDIGHQTRLRHIVVDSPDCDDKFDFVKIECLLSLQRAIFSISRGTSAIEWRLIGYEKLTDQLTPRLADWLASNL